MSVLTQQIEAHFGMDMDQLQATATAAPVANPETADVVKWHGLLVEAQGVLERAEDNLLAALHTRPGEADDPAMDLAHRVNAAVTVRDGRAMVVRWLLDPDAPGKEDLAAERLARLRPRTGPAVQTGVPHRPAGTAVPASVARAGRPAR